MTDVNACTWVSDTALPGVWMSSTSTWIPGAWMSSTAYLDVEHLNFWYLDVGSPGDDGEVDGENDDEYQNAGEEEEPVLAPEFHAWNKPLISPASPSNVV
jgi:hypothetical protein